MAADITAKMDFRAFMSANSPYMASRRGYCPLYITLDCVNSANETRAEALIHVSPRTIPAMPTQFMSSSGKLQYRPVNLFDDATTIEGGDSPPHNNVAQQNDYHDTEVSINGADISQPCEFGQNIVEEESEPREDGCNRAAQRSCSTAVPSSRNQFIWWLPPVAPSVITPNDAFSGTRLSDVCVGKIFNTKQELRDKLGLVALKNYFQFKVYKSTTDRFEAKCLVQGCQWQIRATKSNRDTYFRVTKMNTVHSCQNEELQDSHRQASTRLIRELIKDKFKDCSRSYTPRNIRDDAKYKMRAQKTETFMAAYFLAAKAYRFSECNEYMQNLWVMHPAAVDYLENEIGLHRWARAHFPSRRYDLLTTNIAESMNSLLRHARSLPIIPLVDYIRPHVQRWFYERREQAAARDAILTPAAQTIIDKQLELSRPMTVEPVSRNEFENVWRSCLCISLKIQQFWKNRN
ncbi:MuDR family transposase [Melia azedarach]|uniref:MuDR family transposase n=1 Tax=Melia azedarach TaxID=155640 RepID=A0ACC1Y037_MELAZ|nr:MuDR family transposase [Melia azedarach]